VRQSVERGVADWHVLASGLGNSVARKPSCDGNAVPAKRWFDGASVAAKTGRRLIPRKGMSFRHTKDVSEKGSIDDTSEKT